LQKDNEQKEMSIMRLNTTNINNTFHGKIVIPIPNWLAWLRWLDSNKISRFITISWGESTGKDIKELE